MWESAAGTVQLVLHFAAEESAALEFSLHQKSYMLSVLQGKISISIVDSFS